MGVAAHCNGGPSLRQNKRKSRPPGGFFFLAARSKPPARLARGIRRAPPTGGPYPNLLTASAAQRQKRRAPWARVVPLFKVYLNQPAPHPDRAAKLPRSIMGRMAKTTYRISSVMSRCRT